MTYVTRLPILICLVGLLVFPGCDTDNDPTPLAKGKNRITLTTDGFDGEYYVHVPEGYTGETPTPVVFMLHGTSGTGLDMYDRSGWVEVGETENILTVFPSSLRYCIIDPVDGQKTTTKWNAQPVEWTFCPGVQGRDDIRFLRAVMDDLAARLNIDEKRIYLVGFSNGGQMAAKCTVELSDRLAAVIENAGTFFLDTTYVPLRKLPVAFQIGNKDYGPGVDGPEISLARIDEILSDPNYKPGRSARTHINTFGLSDQYTISGDTNSVIIATYHSLTPGSPNSYRFVFVKGLGHAYPNGTNHWMEAAQLHWEWLKQFSLP